MNASVRDKEEWITEQEDEFAGWLSRRPFVELPEELQATLRLLAEQSYTNTLADYAESRGEDR